MSQSWTLSLFYSTCAWMQQKLIFFHFIWYVVHFIIESNWSINEIKNEKKKKNWIWMFFFWIFFGFLLNNNIKGCLLHQRRQWHQWHRLYIERKIWKRSKEIWFKTDHDHSSGSESEAFYLYFVFFPSLTLFLSRYMIGHSFE